MNFTEIAMVYIPCPHETGAKELTQKLMSEKLIVCGNIHTGGHSIFPWEGQIVTEPECYLICKTMPELAEKVAEKAIEYHPYDLPGIIFWNTKANAPYAAWVKKHTVDAR